MDEALSKCGANDGDQRPTKTGQGPTFHLHMHLTQAAVTGSAGHTHELGLGPVVRVDGHGPRSLEAVQGWLAELAPGAVVKVTPVVDLRTEISVDAYQVPTRIAAQVAERDLCCQFPWCGRQGQAFDLDHIEPYRERQDGGPPGQTTTANLARLCRFHHRVKTHTAWDYHRDPSSTLRRTSPLRHSYTVTDGETTSHH